MKGLSLQLISRVSKHAVRELGSPALAALAVPTSSTLIVKHRKHQSVRQNCPL